MQTLAVSLHPLPRQPHLQNMLDTIARIWLGSRRSLRVPDDEAMRKSSWRSFRERLSSWPRSPGHRERWQRARHGPAKDHKTAVSLHYVSLSALRSGAGVPSSLRALPPPQRGSGVLRAAGGVGRRAKRPRAEQRRREQSGGAPAAVARTLLMSLLTPLLSSGSPSTLRGAAGGAVPICALARSVRPPVDNLCRWSQKRDGHRQYQVC